jgi:hypothetical protein
MVPTVNSIRLARNRESGDACSHAQTDLVGDHRAVLLDNNPPAIIGYDEAVQIEIEAILHSGTVDLGDAPSAAPSKPTRSPIATSSYGVCRECLPRPRQTWTPSSFKSGVKPRFKAYPLDNRVADPNLNVCSQGFCLFLTRA